MKYIVKQILEPDYGCEERPEDYKKMDAVVLRNMEGDEMTVEIADQDLYEKGIEEGDWVYFDRNSEIFKEE